MERNAALISALFNTIEEFSQSQYTAFLKGDKEKNEILSNNSHMLMIMWVMSANFNAEKASNIPFALQERLGRVDMRFLAECSLKDIETAMEGLHRFPKKRAGYLHKMAKHITEKYDGDPNNIWKNNVPSVEVTRRLLEITGFGPELSKMVPINLVRNFQMRFPDVESMDVKVDVHLSRVMTRTGLSRPEADNREIARDVRETAKSVGRYPMELDLPLWVIGKWHCHAQNPSCRTCPLGSYCAKVITHGKSLQEGSTPSPKMVKTIAGNQFGSVAEPFRHGSSLASEQDFWSMLQRRIKSENISTSAQKVRSGYSLDVTMGTSGVFTNIEMHAEYIDVSIMIVTREQMSNTSKAKVVVLEEKTIKRYFAADCELLWFGVNYSGTSQSRQRLFAVRKKVSPLDTSVSVDFVVDTLKKCKDIINTMIK